MQTVPLNGTHTQQGSVWQMQAEVRPDAEAILRSKQPRLLCSGTTIEADDLRDEEVIAAPKRKARWRAAFVSQGSIVFCLVALCQSPRGFKGCSW